MELEEKRSSIIHQYEILDTDAEESFDNLAKLATQICDTSSAQINFIDKNRQWSKANIGWGSPELPLETSFCVHAVDSGNSLMVVPDARKDERFKDNPLTKTDPSLRFYVGAVIKSYNDYPIGTICVFDSKPKKITDKQLEALQILSNEVETHLKLRIDRSQLNESLAHENRLNQEIIQNLPLNFFMYNSEFELVRWNENCIETTGYSEQEMKQMRPDQFFDSDNRSFITDNIEEVFNGKQVTFEADIINKDGSSIPFIFSASRFKTNDQSYLIGTGQDITQQKETQLHLEESLHEKEILLTEIHHRVKNNLAVISGLIQLETLDLEETEVNKKLLNTSLRIRSVAKIHEIMYQTENFTHVVFENVVESIANYIKNTYPKSDDIPLIFKAERLTLNVNQAVPCGLIINELLTNAWKHAYPTEEKGVIELELNEENGLITLRIADQGVGLPQNINPEAGDSLGFIIVKQLCSQLKAEMKLNRHNGTEIVIQFTKKDIKGAGSSLNSIKP